MILNPAPYSGVISPIAFYIFGAIMVVIAAVMLYGLVRHVLADELQTVWAEADVVVGLAITLNIIVVLSILGSLIW